MRSKLIIYLFIIIYTCLFSVNYLAQSDRIEVGIDEKLGDYLPLDLYFVNSEGDSVQLTVTEPRNHTIHYFAVDTLGNEETPKTKTFTIYADTVAPESTCEIQGIPYTG